MILDNSIATGNFADIYLNDGKLVKLFKDLLPDTKAEYEAYKQRYAYMHGLPVPYVFDVTKINGKQAIIMEFVPGKTIGNIIIEDMTKTEQYMSLSVDVQLKIHDLKASGFDLMADKLKHQILSASVLSEKQKNALIEKLLNMEYEKRLCHGDYHIHNIIFNGIGITIIDWADSSAGDIKADVYRTYMLYALYSRELADLYLRLYCEKSGLSQKDIFIWEPIIVGAKLSKNVAPQKVKKLLEIVNLYYPE